MSYIVDNVFILIRMHISMYLINQPFTFKICVHVCTQILKVKGFNLGI